MKMDTPSGGRISWYKRDPDAALQGMFELTLEERGAYNTVLDLIYARANNLPDDDRFIAGCMRCDVRVWRRLKERLIALGKIRIDGGRIRNRRADIEVDAALGRIESAAKAGVQSGRSRSRQSDGAVQHAAQHRPLSSPELTIINDGSQQDKSVHVSRENNNLARTVVATETERTLELSTSTSTKKDHPLTPSPPSQTAKPKDDGLCRDENGKLKLQDWPPKPGLLSTEESERLYARAVVRAWPSPARRTPEEEAARLDQDATIIADQFLHQHAIYWPNEGEMRMARMPLLSLRAEARHWLEQGCDIETFIDVFDARMSRMAATGKSPPRSIKAFHLSLHDSVAARMAG